MHTPRAASTSRWRNVERGLLSVAQTSVSARIILAIVLYVRYFNIESGANNRCADIGTLAVRLLLNWNSILPINPMPIIRIVILLGKIYVYSCVPLMYNKFICYQDYIREIG